MGKQGKKLPAQVHVIDAYLAMKARAEQGEATQDELAQAEVSLLVWATMVVQRESTGKVVSIQAYQLRAQLTDRATLQRIFSDPEQKEVLLALLVQWPRGESEAQQ